MFTINSCEDSNVNLLYQRHMNKKRRETFATNLSTKNSKGKEIFS